MNDVLDKIIIWHLENKKLCMELKSLTRKTRGQNCSKKNCFLNIYLLVIHVSGIKINCACKLINRQLQRVNWRRRTCLRVANFLLHCCDVLCFSHMHVYADSMILVKTYMYMYVSGSFMEIVEMIVV